MLELVLVEGRIVTIAGKAIQFPDDNPLKLLFRSIGDHALEVRAVICHAGYGTVDVFPDDVYIIALGILVAVPELTFDGLLPLAVRRETGVDYSVQP